ncbi:MAG: HlyC/CorC family transporter [Mucilaginibacter polytrichastri]|nr:HlyC/CorC family transporter [Mucilaginibacter polytrichastri]
MDPDLDISGFHIFATLFLVLLNGFFVAAEFAIVKVRASQIEIQAKSGSRMARIAKGITQNLDAYLAATQLGITLASLGLGWVGESVMTKTVFALFGLLNIEIGSAFATNAGHFLAFLVITILHIVFGELAPKSFAIQKPVATTMFVSVPLQLFYIICRPFIWLLNGLANIILKIFGIHTAQGHEAHHSSEELQYLLDQGKETGVIDSSEHELIQNVFEFNERVVKNIMVPRTKMSAIEVSVSKEVLLSKIISEGYSRMPVYEDIVDKIVGVVHAKDILPLLVSNSDFKLIDIIRKPFFVPETKKVNDLLIEMKQKRLMIAIVLDEFGGTAGMVTLEDIVEELVGDIQDEYDEEKPVVEKISDTEFIVDAEATIYDVNEFLPHDIPEDRDFDTVAGWLSDLFGRIPEVGEQREADGYNITVLRKSENNIESVKLELVINQEDAIDLH